MRRPDTQEEMRALIKKLRERIPGVTIRSTFIVGFPGETDAQYHTLRNFIEEMRLDKVGVFTYSREEGTPACCYPKLPIFFLASTKKLKPIHLSTSLS